MSEDEVHKELLYGLEDGDWFAHIQYSGVAASGVSVLAHIVLVTYLNMHSVGAAAGLSPGKWPVTERCFVHMALLNALFSCCHLLDLLRICAMETTSPSDVCSGFAAVFHSRVVGESQMALTAIVLSIMLYLRERPAMLGQWQWRLFFPMYLLPLLISLFLMIVKNLFGGGGPWCFLDLLSSSGQLYTKVLLGLVLLLWVFNAISAVVLLCAINRKRTESTLGEIAQNSLRSAETILVFVPLCIVNQLVLVVYLAWSLSGPLPLSFVLTAVILTNLHGLSYGAAYAMVRRRCTIIVLPKTPVVLQLHQLRNSEHEARERGIMNIQESLQASIAAIQLEPERKTQSEKAFTNLHYVEDIEI